MINRIGEMDKWEKIREREREIMDWERNKEWVRDSGTDRMRARKWERKRKTEAEKEKERM